MSTPDPGLIYDLTTGVFRSPVVRLALQLDWFLQNTSLDTIHMLHPSELRINLLGPPQLTWRGDPFDATRRQGRGLLFYLAHAAAPARASDELDAAIEYARRALARTAGGRRAGRGRR